MKKDISKTITTLELYLRDARRGFSESTTEEAKYFYKGKIIAYENALFALKNN